MITLIIFLLTFILLFILIVISIMKGIKAYYIPIEIEKLSCPRCSSKEIEAIGYRTIKCKKCGFIFSIGGEIVYYGWFPFIFFWPLWFPIIFLKKNRG